MQHKEDNHALAISAGRVLTVLAFGDMLTLLRRLDEGRKMNVDEETGFALQSEMAALATTC